MILEKYSSTFLRLIDACLDNILQVFLFSKSYLTSISNNFKMYFSTLILYKKVVGHKL